MNIKLLQSSNTTLAPLLFLSSYLLWLRELLAVVLVDAIVSKSNRGCRTSVCCVDSKKCKYPSQNLLILLKQEPLVENIEYYSLGQI